MEDALHRLNEIIVNRKLKFHAEYSRLSETLQNAGGLIYEVKYSYLSAVQVADLEATRKIVDSIAGFKRIIEQSMKSTGYKPATPRESLVQAELSYSFRIAEGLQNRLRSYDDDPAHAVDILAVEISQSQSIPDSKNLTECRCTDGIRIWRIATNLPGIKNGTRLACAILPPVDMMNTVSEAMFLGSAPLPPSTELGVLKNPSSSMLDQARAQAIHIIKRMT